MIKITIKCGSNWKSVRKVRYLEDIETGIDFSLNYQNKLYDKDALSSLLVKNRYNRSNLIKKHHQHYPRSDRSIYGSKFKVTLPDTLVFFKEIKILDIVNNKVFPSELSKKYNMNDKFMKKNILIIQYLIESKYKAYICYILKLIADREFKIPQHLQKRDKETRLYLNNMGVNTDVVSFYTIRDILYELDIINWFINNNKELIIYPTCDVTENMNRNYEKYIQLDYNQYINIYKKIDLKKFYTDVVEKYLNLCNRRYGTNLNIVPLRDAICYKYKIGDYHFKNLIEKISNQKKVSHNIQLNHGYTLHRKRNYDLKLISLPKVSSNRLALYIRIKETV